MPPLAFAKGGMATVDVEKVLLQSNAAHLGNEHIKKVREILDKGHTDITKELSRLPEKQRQKETKEAAQALNKQFELERAAVTQVITKMMIDEIKTFRISNDLDIILPRQIVLDADAGIDITNQIVKAMNEKSPVFGKLPIVQINKQKK